MPEEILTQVPASDGAPPSFTPESADFALDDAGTTDPDAATTQDDEASPETQAKERRDKAAREGRERRERERQAAAERDAELARLRTEAEDQRQQIAQLREWRQRQEQQSAQQAQQEVTTRLSTWRQQRFRELTDPNHEEYVGDAAARIVIRAEESAIQNALRAQAAEVQATRNLETKAIYEADLARQQVAKEEAARFTEIATDHGLTISLNGQEILDAFGSYAKRENLRDEAGRILSVPTHGSQITRLARELYNAKRTAATTTADTTARRQALATEAASGAHEFEPAGAPALSARRIWQLYGEGDPSITEQQARQAGRTLKQQGVFY